METKTTDTLKIYFLLLRLALIISGLIVLSILLTDVGFLAMGIVIPGLIMCAGQFYGSLLSEKLIREKSYVGAIFAFVLNSMILLSVFFPVSLFGFYVLFRKDFRAKYLDQGMPSWLEGVFTFVDELVEKINGSKAKA